MEQQPEETSNSDSEAERGSLCFTQELKNAKIMQFHVGKKRRHF